MVEEVSARLTSALALSDEASVNLEILGGEALQDCFFYLVGKVLAKKSFSSSAFMTAMAGVWGLRDRLTIREETESFFIFQFRVKEERDRILHGGPWFFNNFMVVLAEYDGLGAVEAVPLHFLAVWVAVKGLSVALRNESALRLIGGTLGGIIRLDQGALRRREAVQRIRVSIDTRRRIRIKRTFIFSPIVSVDLDLTYEKCHGICTACGFFLHGPEGCDEALLVATTPLPSGDVVSTGGGGVLMSGETVLQVTKQKEVMAGAAYLFPLEPVKANGKGRTVPINPLGISSLFKVGAGLDRGQSPLFSVKGFTAEGFAAIPKIGVNPSLEIGPCVKMVGNENQLSGGRRPAGVMLIQPGKKARVVVPTETSKDLALTVVPQLALADKNGRIIVSPVKQKKKGRPVGAKNKVKGDKLASVAIAERPKVRRRKLKIVAMDEGSAASSS